MSNEIELSLRDLIRASVAPLKKKNAASNSLKKPQVGAEASAKPKNGSNFSSPYPFKPQRRWTPKALVLQMLHIHCACGAEFTVPAAKGPLVRVVNERTGTMWEMDQIEASIPLPKEIRWHSTFITTCDRCFDSLIPENQGDLFLSPDSIEALNELLTIREKLP